MWARRSLWKVSGLLALGLANGHADGLEHRALPTYIVAAVADPARPATDTSRGACRKPAKTLAFAGIKPGDHVAELIPASGYFTRLLSAVVGPAGKVYAAAPPAPKDWSPGEPAPAAAVQAIAADAHYSNVTAAVVKLREDGSSGDTTVTFSSVRCDLSTTRRSR